MRELNLLVAERAQREGLLDVAYATVDSPFGPLTAAATERGLVMLAYPEHRTDDVLVRLAGELSPRVLEAPARLDAVRRELDEYFEGRRRAVRALRSTSRSRTASTARCSRPRRRSATGRPARTRASAAGAGSPKAVRAAGSGLGSNPIPVVVPCHRVLRAGGKLGGYTGGVERSSLRPQP